MAAKQREMRVQTIDVLETNIPLMLDIWEMGTQVVVGVGVQVGVHCTSGRVNLLWRKKGREKLKKVGLVFDLARADTPSLSGDVSIHRLS